MKEQTLITGEIVLSRAGRDRGRAFVITEVRDTEYVLIADGRLRKIDRPKKKKRKHLLRVSEARMAFPEHLLDADIRKFLTAQGFSNDRNE